MSVLIKGMEMPKNCDDCPLNYDSIDCMVADNALREKGGGDFLFDHERHPNCPLVPVPPHGRLIDADDVFRVLTSYYHHSTDFQHEALKESLARVSTIIPAEESD